MRRWCFLLSLALTLCFPEVLSGQDGQEVGDSPAVRLIVLAPGSDILSRFGHAAIWVEDSVASTNMAYNYGLSNIYQEGFLRDLWRGRVRSRPSTKDALAMIDGYREGGREVTVVDLKLTPEQRQRLVYLLRRDSRPGAPWRQEDFFRSNCTTGLRDVLNEALDGVIRASTVGVPVSGTYRSLSMEMVREWPLMNFGLLLGLGRAVDQPLDAWEEMFMPELLLARLTELGWVEGVWSDGKEEDGQEERGVGAGGDAGESVSMSAGAGASASEGANWRNAMMEWRSGAFRLLFVLASWGIAAFLFVQRRGRERGYPGKAYLRVTGGWVMLSGIIGSVLTSLWLLTSYEDLQWNMNVLLFSPLGVFVGERMLAAAAGNQRAYFEAVWVGYGIALLAAVGMVMSVAGVGQWQHNGILYLGMVPLYAEFVRGGWKLGISSPQRDHAYKTDNYSPSAGAHPVYGPPG
jgi:hypothetical protein